jgi:hypothetical protein
MNSKEIVILTIGAIGWAWALMQYFSKSKKLPQQSANGERLTAYSSFLKKSGELNESIQKDPNRMYNIDENLMERLQSEDENERENAITEFNAGIIGFTRKALKPIEALNEEMRRLNEAGSPELQPLTREYTALASELKEEFEQTMDNIAVSRDIQYTSRLIQSIGQDSRIKRLHQLQLEIQEQVRKEM